MTAVVKQMVKIIASGDQLPIEFLWEGPRAPPSSKVQPIRSSPYAYGFGASCWSSTGTPPRNCMATKKVCCGCQIRTDDDGVMKPMSWTTALTRNISSGRDRRDWEGGNPCPVPVTEGNAWKAQAGQVTQMGRRVRLRGLLRLVHPYKDLIGIGVRAPHSGRHK